MSTWFLEQSACWMFRKDVYIIYMFKFYLFYCLFLQQSSGELTHRLQQFPQSEPAAG